MLFFFLFFVKPTCPNSLDLKSASLGAPGHKILTNSNFDNWERIVSSNVKSFSVYSQLTTQQKKTKLPATWQTVTALTYLSFYHIRNFHHDGHVYNTKPLISQGCFAEWEPSPAPYQWERVTTFIFRFNDILGLYKLQMKIHKHEPRVNVLVHHHSINYRSNI